MLDDQHVLELLPAYVLGTLEEEEARIVGEHLAGCYLCRQELDAFQEVAAQLPLAVPEARPARDLSPRLMERIQGLDSRPIPPPAGWRWPRRMLPIGAVAGLLLILLLGFSNLLLWQRMNNAEVLSGPLGMRAIALKHTAAAPTASGFVVMGADGQNGVLVVDKLPALDATREYQVWLVRDSSYTGGAVFSVDETGYRGVRLQAPNSLLSYSAVWVTVEPTGGSPNPTSDPVLNGSLFNP